MKGSILLSVLYFLVHVQSLTPLTGSIHLKAKPYLCLDARSGLLQPGDLIQLYTCSYAPNQVFTFMPDGTIRVASNHSLCVIGQNGDGYGQALALQVCPTIFPGVFTHRGDGTIRPEGSPYCFNSRSSNMAVGDVIQLYTCNGGANEIFFVMNDHVQGALINDISPSVCIDSQLPWNLQLVSGELLRLEKCGDWYNQVYAFASDNTIRSIYNPALCFNIQNSVKSGEKVQLYTCSAASNEIWEKRSDGTIRPLTNTALCLTAPGAPNTGADLIVTECTTLIYNTYIAQVWTLTPVSTQGGFVHPVANPSVCFNSQSDNIAPGNLIQLYACNGGMNELMYFDASGRIFMSAKPGICLAPVGGQVGSGVAIELVQCDVSSSAQLWVKGGDGTIRAESNQGLCMNAAGGTLTSGTIIQLYTCSANYNEVWYVSPV